MSYIFELSDENFNWIRSILESIKKDIGIEKLDKLLYNKHK